MNKRCLWYFTTVLLAFLIIAPGIVAADDNTYTDVTVSEAKDMLKDGDVCLLDVRTQGEFDAAHLKYTKLIPIKLALGSTVPYVSEKEFLSEVKKSGIKKDEPILVYCLSGARSTKASEYLANNGYTVYNMKVGIQGWIDVGYPIVSTFVDESGVEYCIKKPLNAKINCLFLQLEQGDDDKAKEEISKFICFVNTMEQVGRISLKQANYLRDEAGLIGKMI